MAYTGGESGGGIPIATGGQQTPFGGKQGNGASSETINLKQKIGVTETSLYTSSTTAAKGVLFAPKSVSISNSGGAPAGVVMKLNYWTADSTKDSNEKYMQFLIGKNEIVNIPISRTIISDDAIIYDGTALAQAAPDSNMYKTVTSDHSSGSGDQQLDGAINDSTSTTTVTVDDGSYFRVGDLIQVGTEIMDVTAISGENLTVIRATNGSTIASHSDNANIRFPFFNAYHNFSSATGGYGKVQTDDDGKFKAFNFFGYGRAADYTQTGILPGSVAIKCYNPGYQELGLSGITSGTKSGLVASGSYWFKIAIDGGTAESINFTVDSSNTNFGGRNGILSKIQAVLDEKYYNTASNTFEQKATVAIVNGDIRFTSGSRLSTSAIALTAGVDGASAAYNIFAQQNGRFPALAKIATAIAARLPDNTLPAASSAQSVSNINAFMYDDGGGNLIGKGTGTIDYETGVIDFRSYPNSEFVVSARYGSSLSGSVSDASFNTIEDISARSLNDNIETTISLRVSGYNLNL